MNTVIVSTLIAVLNSLWQAAVLAALVCLALRFAPRMNAATRFAIWWATLAVVLILPAAPRFISSVREWFQPAPIESTRPLYVPPATPAPAIDVAPLVTVEERRSSRWPLWVASVWGGILLFRLAQIGRSYVYLRGLKRRAVVSDYALPATRRPARFLLSSDIDSPIAVGFARPAVILPDSLPSELSKEEMEHVLLHESAHLARWDDWTNLLGRILGGVLALHPVALWILRRIEIERESACDDWVVARTQAARPYAQSLARLYELRLARRQAAAGELLAAGIFGRGSHFGERVDSLLRRGRDFTPRVKGQIVTGSVGTLLLAAGIVSLFPRWVALAQVRPSFEVASIKLNSSASPNSGWRGSPDGSLQVSNMSVMDLITSAYQVHGFEVSGGPAWLRSSLYDITAKAAPGATAKRIPEMVQTLLEERFRLRLHRESKDMPIYSLRVAKGGARIEPAKEGTCRAEPATTREEVTKSCGYNMLSPTTYDMLMLPMEKLAATLSGLTGRRVADETELTGRYSLHLDFAPEQAEDSSRPSIFTALQEQLGLRLESSRGPVEMLVIDGVERPSEN